MSNPFDVVDQFEKELCEYTGAPFAVAVSSCTDALGICFEYHYQYDLAHGTPKIVMPSKTYIGVAMQAKRTGYSINFVDYDWQGEYLIDPISVWDSARKFHRGMFDNMVAGTYKCVSFHASKILGYTHGGAILHNNKSFDKWAREARFDGRDKIMPDQPTVLGRHANMTPDIAAALRYKLYHLPKYNQDLPNSDYPDLSKMEIFK